MKQGSFAALYQVALIMRRILACVTEPSPPDVPTIPLQGAGQTVRSGERAAPLPAVIGLQIGQFVGRDHKRADRSVETEVLDVFAHLFDTGMCCL